MVNTLACHKITVMLEDSCMTAFDKQCVWCDPTHALEAVLVLLQRASVTCTTKVAQVVICAQAQQPPVNSITVLLEQGLGGQIIDTNSTGVQLVRKGYVGVLRLGRQRVVTWDLQ